MPRLLTLQDLYNHYASLSRNVHFSAKNDNDTIVVHVEGKINHFDKQEDEYSPSQGLIPVTLQSCHILENINDSYISRESMEDALPSFSNRPILAYIYKDKNGDYQFRDHTMHLDEDGEVVYDEQPVGVVPESCDAHLEYDEEKDKTYVVVNGLIFAEYSKAYEILCREEECSVSVELEIRELSFDAKNKLLVLENFFFNGVTILGRWENGQKVEPGMAGSNIRLADFKAKNNKTFSQENVLSMLEEINNKIDRLQNTNFQRKEDNAQVNKFEELLAKYSKTAEDITFDYEGISDEELEKAFAEAFESSTSEPTSAENEEANPSAEGEGATSTADESTVIEGAEGETTESNFSKTFELSHDDIRCGLYTLLLPYEETDNTYYYISKVFDTYFIYESWDGDKVYRQNYAKEGDNVKFVGDRVHLNIEYLTDNELATLTEMRSNYTKFEEISAKLAKYEDEPKKMELLESTDYANLADSKDFIELKEEKNHFDLSIDELRKKCDDMLLEYAKKTTFSAKATQNKVTTLPTMPSGRKSVSGGRYGHMFD